MGRSAAAAFIATVCHTGHAHFFYPFLLLFSPSSTPHTHKSLSKAIMSSRGQKEAEGSNGILTPPLLIAILPWWPLVSSPTISQNEFGKHWLLLLLMFLLEELRPRMAGCGFSLTLPLAQHFSHSYSGILSHDPRLKQPF